MDVLPNDVIVWSYSFLLKMLFVYHIRYYSNCYFIISCFAKLDYRQFLLIGMFIRVLKLNNCYFERYFWLNSFTSMIFWFFSFFYKFFPRCKNHLLWFLIYLKGVSSPFPFYLNLCCQNPLISWAQLDMLKLFVKPVYLLLFQIIYK